MLMMNNIELELTTMINNELDYLLIVYFLMNENWLQAVINLY